MAAKLQGRVTNVSDDDLGSSLDGDHAAGATTLTVQNAADFDEDGGTLVINDQQIVYTSCDDDSDTITLDGALAAAADDGDTVSVWDTLREVIAVDKHAEVDVGPDYADDIEATVAMHLVDHLVEGPRGDDGESVILELDEEDDEWKVVEILGLGGPGASGVRFEADDVYTLTTADITLGVAVVALSHRPIDESLVAVWGIPQEPTEYTIDYDGRTATFPLEGFEEAGDRIWVHYAYLKGLRSREVLVDWQASGWRHLQTTLADSTDRSAPGFDDSAWASAAAAFGYTPEATHPWGYPKATTGWPIDTVMWLRRSVDVPAGVSQVTVQVRVDNEADIYWNGTLVGSHVGGPDGVSPPFTVSSFDAGASNTLAIRAEDGTEAGSGGPTDRTYIDVKVEAFF